MTKKEMKAAAKARLERLYEFLINEPFANKYAAAEALGCALGTVAIDLRRAREGLTPEIVQYIKDKPAVDAYTLIVTFNLDTYKALYFIARVRHIMEGKNPARKKRVCVKSKPEIDEEKVLSLYKEDPAAGLKGVAKKCAFSYFKVTVIAKRLIEKRLLPESVLNAPASVYEAGYAQYIEDWEEAPEEMKNVSIDEACYMYNVERADILQFEDNSGYRLTRINSSPDACDPTVLEYTARALSDALDRRVSIAELARVSRLTPTSIELSVNANNQLLKYIDPDLKSTGESFPYKGEFLEGAGEYNPPEVWFDEVQTRGGMGINLTGGFWRRYFDIWEHRNNGFELTSKGWVLRKDRAPK